MRNPRRCPSYKLHEEPTSGLHHSTRLDCGPCASPCASGIEVPAVSGGIKRHKLEPRIETQAFAYPLQMVQKRACVAE